MSDSANFTTAENPNSLSALDFFSLTKIHIDGWNALSIAAIKLANAQQSGKDVDALLDEMLETIDFREVYESFFAYPGETLYGELRKLFDDRDFVGLSKAVGHIRRSLMYGAYRNGLRSGYFLNKRKRKLR